MENHIKSEDLCNRCIYDFDRHCEDIPCECCEMWMHEEFCACLLIKDNTPCPYFVDAENNAAD